MDIQLSYIKQTMFRLALYAFVVMVIAEFLVLDIISFAGTNDFQEGSFTKALQITICSINSILLIFYAIKPNFKFRSTALFVFGLIFSVGIIESGKLASLWLLFVLAFAVLVVFILRKNRNVFLSELNLYVRSFSFGLFFVGFMIAFVFSELMGRNFFWTAVLEGVDYTLAQNAIKEGLKLLGCFLILTSTVELKFLSDKK